MRLILIFLLSSLFALANAREFVLVSESYPPYEYEENGEAKGMDVEILQAVAKNANIHFRIIFQPWQRALRSVQQGEVDGIFSILHNKERESFLHYPKTPLFYGRNSLFANDAFVGDIHSLNELQGKRVGVVAGNSYGKAFDSRSDILKDPAVNIASSFKKLINHRHEFLVTTQEVGWYFIQKENAMNVRQLSLVIMEEPYYLAVAKHSISAQELLNLLETHLGKLEKTGALAKIRNKYRNSNAPSIRPGKTPLQSP